MRVERNAPLSNRVAHLHTVDYRPGLGSLVENNTPKLVADIEAIREHLGIERWGLVFGGSWGSTLSLAYVQEPPSRARSVVLRGIFTFTPQEIDYLFQNGLTAGQSPAAWEAYCRCVAGFYEGGSLAFHLV